MEKQSFKIRLIKTIWRVTLIVIGATINAAGIVFLLKPHNLLSGGATGLSMLISYVTPVNIGLLVILINIPLFIIAWKKIDLHFCVYSIIGIAAMSAAIVVLEYVPNPLEVSYPLLASLFGGILTGGGGGLVLRARGSLGGTDIASVVIRQKFSISIGLFSFYINLVIVALLALKFGAEPALLTIFSQYVSMRAVDRVVTGLNTAKGITIVSDHSDEIAKYIMERMYRGVTFIDGQGGFGRRQKKIIWCVVTTSQLSRIKAAAKSIDPDAFIAISDASEIVGEGFYRTPF